MEAIKTVTPDAISKIIANPSPRSSSDVIPELVVQVIDLRTVGNRFMFTASDGKQKLKGILARFVDMVSSGAIQNLGLIRILEYSLVDIPIKPEKYLIVLKCEAISPALEAEIKAEVKNVEADDVSQAKPEMVAESAAPIFNEQRGNMAPAARMARKRRVHPLASLNQGNWTVEVRVTSKGTMHSYNVRGEGNVFNVELTDQDDGEENVYPIELKDATSVPYNLRVSVTQQGYMSEKRQRITVETVVPVDYAAESRFLLEEISKMKAS